MHFPTKNSPFGSVLNGPKIYGLLSIKKLRGDFGIRELYIDRLKTCLLFGVFLFIPVDLYRRVAGGWWSTCPSAQLLPPPSLPWTRTQGGELRNHCPHHRGPPRRQRESTSGQQEIDRQRERERELQHNESANALKRWREVLVQGTQRLQGSVFVSLFLGAAANWLLANIDKTRQWRWTSFARFQVIDD